MSFNVNNLPLAPQSKEISDSYNHDYNHKVGMDRHVQEHTTVIKGTSLHGNPMQYLMIYS